MHGSLNVSEVNSGGDTVLAVSGGGLGPLLFAQR